MIGGMQDNEKTRDDLLREVQELRAANERDHHDRRRAESALRQSEERYRAIVAAFDGLVYVCSHDYRIEFMNQRMIERTGRDATGEPCFKALHDLNEPCPWCVNERVFSGETVRWEVKSPKDGRWYDVVNTPIRHPDGTYSKQAMIRDITERKLIDNVLRESEEKFRTLFRSIPDFVVVSTLDTGTYVDVNDAFERVTGFSREEALGRTATELGIWAVPEQRERLLAILREQGRFADQEIAIRTRGGQIRTMLLSGEVVTVLGMPCAIAAATDVTEQRKLERMLRFQAQIVGNVHDSIVVTDFGGKILFWNRGAEKLFGYSAREVLGRHISIVLTDSPNPEEFEEKLREVDGYETEALLKKKSGELFTGLLSLSLFFDETDRPMGVIGFCIDISERKRLEGELRTSHTELERKIGERTVALERANRAKDVFLANMSHEIRTPLSGVLGFSDLLLERDIPEDVRSDVAIIRDSAAAALSMLNDVLDLSRIELERLELRPVPFDPVKLLKELVKPFERLATEKGLKLETVVQPCMHGRVTGDPDRIGQIVKNLLQNAIKFTLRGTVRVRMYEQDVVDDSIGLFIEVSDTGIGIEQAKLKEIFDPFTQADSSYSKTYGGTGLGLTISRTLAGLMGGGIAVESTPGKGSTFTARIKVREAPPEVEAFPAPERSLVDLPPMSVLLAEDNTVNRMFLERALTRGGHRVKAVSNGLEVLEELAKAAYDCILMDIQMPVMDGMTTTRSIRTSHSPSINPAVPIVALTAYAMKGDREKFLAAGMDGYVTKPVDFGELATALAEAVHIDVGR
jgi:PAS domain S-box-containing protein